MWVPSSPPYPPPLEPPEPRPPDKLPPPVVVVVVVEVLVELLELLELRELDVDLLLDDEEGLLKLELSNDESDELDPLLELEDGDDDEEDGLLLELDEDGDEDDDSRLEDDILESRLLIDDFELLLGELMPSMLLEDPLGDRDDEPDLPIISVNDDPRLDTIPEARAMRSSTGERLLGAPRPDAPPLVVADSGYRPNPGGSSILGTGNDDPLPDAPDLPDGICIFPIPI